MKNYIFAFLSVFLIFACSEDQAIKTTKESTAQTGILTTQMVQDLYHSGESYSYNYSDEIEEGCFQVEPFWYLSKEHVTNDGVGIVIVPVRSPREESSEDLELPIYEQLIYYNSEECGIVADYIAYQSRDPLGSGRINNSDFSGNIFTIKGCSCESYTYGLEKGQFTFGMETPSEYFEECQSTAGNRGLGSWLKRIFRPIKCPGYGGGNGGSFWNDLGGFFGSIIGSGGGTGWDWSWSMFDWGGISYYDSDIGNGAGGGGNPNMQDFFDFCFFEGIGSQVAEKLENLIAVHDFEICTENFHEIMQECYESGNTSSNNGDPSNGGLIENGNTNTCNSSESYNVHDYLYWLNDLDQNDPNGCLAQAGQDYGSTHNLTYGDGQLMCHIEKVNSFDATNKEIFNLILARCGDNQSCRTETFGCLGKIDKFQNYSELKFNIDWLNSLLSNSDICAASDQATFDDLVFDQILEHVTNFDLNSLPPIELRLLECESFSWSQIGNSWVSCIEPNELHINIGLGTKLSMDFGCLSYTIPKEHHSSIVNSDGEASSCAALAANLSTISVKTAIQLTPKHKLKSPITEFFMKKIFKESFPKWMKETGCEYGSIATCTPSNCPGGVSEPTYSENFVEVSIENIKGECQ